MAVRLLEIEINCPINSNEEPDHKLLLIDNIMNLSSDHFVDKLEDCQRLRLAQYISFFLYLSLVLLFFPSIYVNIIYELLVFFTYYTTDRIVLDNNNTSDSTVEGSQKSSASVAVTTYVYKTIKLYLSTLKCECKYGPFSFVNIV